MGWFVSGWRRGDWYICDEGGLVWSFNRKHTSSLQL